MSGAKEDKAVCASSPLLADQEKVEISRAPESVKVKPYGWFQMFYVLKGWVKFIYQDEGEYTFNAGDCVLQPAGIVHNELDCSDDLEVLEIYSPAVHETVVVDKVADSAAAD